MAERVTLKGKLLHPTKYIAAEECRDAKGNPRDVNLTIKEIRFEELKKDDGVEVVPIIAFEETPKLLVLNRTNADSIAELHGSKADAWPGKRITIFPTRVKAWGEMKACIRVREKVPPPRNTKAAPSKPTDEATPDTVPATMTSATTPPPNDEGIFGGGGPEAFDAPHTGTETDARY